MVLEGNSIKLSIVPHFTFSFWFSMLNFPDVVLFWLLLLRLWRAAGICTHVLDGHSGPVTSVCSLMTKGIKSYILLDNITLFMPTL